MPPKTDADPDPSGNRTPELYDTNESAINLSQMSTTDKEELLQIINDKLDNAPNVTPTDFLRIKQSETLLEELQDSLARDDIGY